MLIMDLQFNSKDVNKFKEQLLEIKSKQADGHFVSVSGIKPAGDDEVGHLLDRALWWVDTVLERYVFRVYPSTVCAHNQ